jgi:translocation and assembly module TamB
LDGDLNLTGTPDSALLNGQVLIDRLSLTKSFDLATFADQFSGTSSPAPGGLAENVKLNVGIRSSQEMGLSSSELNIQGTTDLRVQGTAADPVIVGRTNITGGELFFRGRRYQVQNGIVQFVNPVQTEPVVNLLVTTVVNQFNLSLNFVGPLDRLRTTYISDPPLPPVDIISLLVQGRTTEAAQSSPATPQSLVAQQLSGQVSSRVQKLAGISSLTIDPQLGGNGTNPGAQLAIQQRVTKNLLFSFATDVTKTQGELIQLEYQITPKYSISAIRDQSGGLQLQVKARKVF